MRRLRIVNPAAGRENSPEKVSVETAAVFGARGKDYGIYITCCRMDTAWEEAR